VQAKDGGSPPRTDTAVVHVTVDRNLNKPVFDPQSYVSHVSETLQLGSVIATVAAKDADLRVSSSIY